MKICIYGAGAIGGFLAAGLARVPEVELSVIARGAHLEAMRKHGLTLEREGERTTVEVNASDDPAAVGPQDYVMIALKAHQAWQSAQAMRPLLGSGTTVVTCQNGVPWWYFHALTGPYEGRRLAAVDLNDQQWNALGPERAVGCSVYPATEIKEPGVIAHTYGDKFALGEPDGSTSQRCKALSQALEAGGFKAPILDDIRSEIWLKLWGNLCFNPISALTRGTLDVIAHDPGTRAVCHRMMSEAQEIAEKLGVSFRVSIERRIDGAGKVGAHRTSMLQDLERGRALEIDALVTAVHEMGELTGTATPTIDAVLALVQQLGRSQGVYPTYPDEALERAGERERELVGS